jgi:hypothetical protein
LPSTGFDGGSQLPIELNADDATPVHCQPIVPRLRSGPLPGASEYILKPLPIIAGVVSGSPCRG